MISLPHRRGRGRLARSLPALSRLVRIAPFLLPFAAILGCGSGGPPVLEHPGPGFAAGQEPLAPVERGKAIKVYLRSDSLIMYPDLAIRGDLVTELILSSARISFKEKKIGEYSQFEYTGLIDDSDIAPAEYDRLAALRAAYPSLRISISIGGEAVEGFSDAVKSEASRERFVGSIVRYVRAHDFDGVDIDWKYPVSGGSLVWGVEADRDNLSSFIALLRSGLDAIERPRGRVSLSLSASDKPDFYERNVDLRAISPHLDAVHLLTWDNDWLLDGVSEHFASPLDALALARAYIAAGVPAEKLFMGIALYGMCIDDSGSLGEPIAPNLFGDPDMDSAQALGWSDIARGPLVFEDYEKHWDDAAKAPWLYAPSIGDFISYEDQRSVAEKARLAAGLGLGGFVAWEYGMDANAELLGALGDALR